MSTPRVRQRSLSMPCPFHLTWKLSSKANWTTWDDSGFSWAVNSTMTDRVTPGYFKASRTGGPLPVNPLDAIQRRLFLVPASPVTWRNAATGGQVVYSGNLAVTGWESSNFPRTFNDLINKGPGTFPQPELPASYHLQRALAKARTSGWDVLTFAAEASKTWDLVARAASRTDRRASFILNRLDRSRTPRRDLLRLFSEMWLEYRYGWRILAYDIESAHEALEKLKQLRSKLLRRTEGETVIANGISNHTRGSFRVPTGGAGLGPRFRARFQWETETELRAGVGLDLGLSSDVVFGDPLVTAYEVIPYSFIADWFFNLNDVVAAWSPFAVGSVAHAFVTTTQRKTVIGEAHPLASNGWVPDSTGTSTYVATYERTIRSPADPTLDVRFRLNMNGAKLTDLLALFFARHAQRLRRMSRR